MKKHCILVWASTIITSFGYGQPGQGEEHRSKVLQGLISHAKVYKESQSRIDGSPFLQPNLVNGEIVTLTGYRFTHPQLNYDLHSGQLFCLHNNQLVPLDMGQILSFTLFSDRHYNFVRYLESDEHKNKGNKGFFLVLYQGKVDLLVVLKKAITRPPGQQNLQFLCKKKYFVLWDNGRLKSLKPSNKNILKVLHHRKYEMQRFIEMQKLNPLHQKDLTIIIEYYDSLI